MDLNWRVNSWFPDLGNRELTKLQKYHSELIHFNKSINLISANSVEHSDAIHIADGILSAKFILDDATHHDIYDIGSGNGIPGIILAILDSSRQIILVDTDSRKCQFLKLMVGRLGLSNVVVNNTQFESIPVNSIHCAVSRGFASMSKTLSLSKDKICSGGAYYSLKSGFWEKELAETKEGVRALFSTRILGEYLRPVSSVALFVIKSERK